jgi:tRNA 5-methylaminomethyl-2-thiouridine biosynthesis bifunctional protein
VKTQPIRAANVRFGDSADEPPAAPDFGDVYHPRVGALAQARHVFLQGNGLPARWAGKTDFTILETGFGLGNNFLATWQAWQQDPARGERLHFVSLELHPPTRAQLQLAHQHSPLPTHSAELIAAWPPLTPGLHRLRFGQGRVQLTLALGDVRDLLPQLRLRADAFFLDGFAPSRNPAMWSGEVLKALARLATPGATAATWSVARALHAGLVTAGFVVQRAAGFGDKRDITTARFAPRHSARRAPDPALDTNDAVVVGAGLAGAAVARALAHRGLAVTVLDAAAGAAQGASGNSAGLFHGTLDADDGPYARLHRTAALWAAQAYRGAIAAGLTGQAQGLLRLASPRPGQTDPLSLLRQLGLPADYVELLDASSASALAGVALTSSCWHYPGGGWIAPPQWVAHALSTPGVRLRGSCLVQALQRAGTGWQLLGAQGQVLAQSRLVVLAAAQGTGTLLAGLGAPAWPLRRVRGQVSQWGSSAAATLRLPLAGDGYAIALPTGFFCGATHHGDDHEVQLREADHRHNLERFTRLTGLNAPTDMALLQGRVAWRLHSDDRLPIAGALPQLALVPGQRLDQARLLPREPGLFVCTALGGRGITWAPLLGELIAAQACGTPWPLEQDLVDALDPGRWIVRQARALQRGGLAGGVAAASSAPA